MTTTSTAAEAIEAAMKTEDRSQKWVAERSNIPLTTFRRKLNGGNEFTLTEILAISTALRVEPADLLPTIMRSPRAAAA